MQVFPEGYTVTYDVPLTDLNGRQLTPPFSASVVLEDANGATLQRQWPAVNEEMATVHFEFEGSYNRLSDDEVGLAGRVVVVRFQTEQGEIERRFFYMLRAPGRLQAPTNSFQSYEAAQFVAYQVPGLLAFASAAATDQENALAEAFLRITRISLKVAHVDASLEILPESRRRFEWTYLRQSDWELVTEEVWNGFPAYFTNALKRAQVIEANAILTGDPIGTKRRAGIISETTGEASMMFRNGIVDLGISSQAVECLTGLVHYDFRVSR